MLPNIGHAGYLVPGWRNRLRGSHDPSQHKSDSGTAFVPLPDAHSARYAWSRDRRILVEATEDGQVAIWNAPVGKIVKTLKLDAPVRRLDISPRRSVAGHRRRQGRHPLGAASNGDQPAPDILTTLRPKSRFNLLSRWQALRRGCGGRHRGLGDRPRHETRSVRRPHRPAHRRRDPVPARGMESGRHATVRPRRRQSGASDRRGGERYCPHDRKYTDRRLVRHAGSPASGPVFLARRERRRLGRRPGHG